MTKRRILSLLFSFILVTVCAFSLVACGKTEYKLYSYESYGRTYNLGDTFYGITLSEDLVLLELDDGELTLTISKAFLSGSASQVNNFETYQGTYTETDSTINAFIPGYSDSTITIQKAVDYFSLQLTSYTTITLKK